MIVQPLQLIPACRSCSIAGSAVATMVWSIEAMNKPMETIAKTSQRRSSASRRDGLDDRRALYSGCLTIIDHTHVMSY